MFLSCNTLHILHRPGMPMKISKPPVVYGIAKCIKNSNDSIFHATTYQAIPSNVSYLASITSSLYNKLQEEMELSRKRCIKEIFHCHRKGKQTKNIMKQRKQKIKEEIWIKEVIMIFLTHILQVRKDV